MNGLPTRQELWWCEPPEIGLRPVVVLSRDVAILPDGRVAIVGSYTGTIPGGAPPLPSAPTDPHDYFFLLMDPTYPPASF